ncbi:hypothetical protein D3C71_1900730 [compost metagenome]
MHNVGIFCPLSQGSFGFYLITGIDEGIHRAERKQTWPVICVHKFVHTLHDTIRVNLGNTIPHGQHLGLAYGRRQGVNLAIDVGFRHMVKINQRDATHPTSRQRFGSP